MASNGSSAQLDLTKLTVPRLKALCKEQRITGYSKLSKAALLQRLAEVAVATKTTTPSNDQAGPNATAAPSTTPSCEPSTPHRDRNTAHQPVQLLTTDNIESTDTPTAKVPLPIGLPKSSQARTVASNTNTQKTSGTKRPAHIDIAAPQKRIRTYLKSATNAGHEPPVPRTSTLQQTLPVDPSVFKIPELPAQRKSLFHGNASILGKQPSGTSKRSPAARRITGGPGRFKLLAVSRPKPVELDQANKELSRAPVFAITPRALDSSLVSNFRATPPFFSCISFPPKASERKWTYRWAIILSSLFPEDRQTCMLVSRTFRYAGREHLSESMILRHVAISCS